MTDEAELSSYMTYLAGDDREIFARMPAGTNLAGEIRMTRTLIARLCGDLEGNSALITRLLSVLASLQSRQARDRSDAAEDDRALTAAGEHQLRLLEDGGHA